MLRLSFYLFLIIFILFFCFLFIDGFSSKSEVKQFIQNIKARKPKLMQSLPEVKKFQSFQYSAQNLRNPFEPFVTSVAIKLPPTVMGTGPDQNRIRELLESYPLDSLHMVGTISRQDASYALVKDRQGIVHRVGIGNYMGQNFGKIQKITDSTIEIREWTVTTQDTYEECTVTMHLSLSTSSNKFFRIDIAWAKPEACQQAFSELIDPMGSQ